MVGAFSPPLPMKTILRSFVLPGLLVLNTGGFLWAKAEKPEASATVQVVFEKPEKYTDLRDDSTDFDNEQGAKRYLPLLKEHLEKEGARRLPAGQTVVVTVTDIDLAGDFEPWRGVNSQDIRIVKEIYFPRVTLTFKIMDASGAVVREGERKLSDPIFQVNLSGGFQSDELRYEKHLLTNWLSDELAPAKK